MFELLEEVKATVASTSKSNQVATMITDSTGGEETVAKRNPQDTANKIAVFQEQAIAAEANALLAGWLETDESDLEEDEGFGDRLYAMMIGLADENKDGEITEDEAEIINVGLNAVADYLIAKGVDEESAVSLLNDFDNNMANNVREIVLAGLPEGEDALFDDMDNVLFTEEDNEPFLDSTQDALTVIAEQDGLTLDAAYRKVFAIRNGKKMKVKKRISGKVRLSAKQRQAIRKAQRKAFTGAAKLKRLKSFRKRRQMGL